MLTRRLQNYIPCRCRAHYALIPASAARSCLRFSASRQLSLSRPSPGPTSCRVPHAAAPCVTRTAPRRSRRGTGRSGSPSSRSGRGGGLRRAYHKGKRREEKADDEHHLLELQPHVPHHIQHNPGRYRPHPLYAYTPAILYYHLTCEPTDSETLLSRRVPARLVLLEDIAKSSVYSFVKRFCKPQDPKAKGNPSMNRQGPETLNTGL